MFTPTRNRAHTLHRVHDSLMAQTLKDLEWLVIDNDSTDGTAELMAGWQRSSPFPIRYLRQENRGLQVSWNRAPREAQGRFMVTLASDDACNPDALERLAALWEGIPEDQRDRFSAVTGLCVDEQGRLIGDRFPSDILDSDPIELRFRYKVHGEKWGFQRVDVMRQFELPIIEGYSGYIPETLLWDAIGRRYRTRYVNEVLRTFTLEEAVGTLSRPRNPADNAPGGYLEARTVLDNDMRWFPVAPIQLFGRAAKVARSGFHSGHGLRDQWRDLHDRRGKVLWLVAWPAGLLVYLAERLGLRHIGRPRVSKLLTR